MKHPFCRCKRGGMEGICYYIHIEIRDNPKPAPEIRFGECTKYSKGEGGNHMLDTAAAGLVVTGEDKEIVDMVHDFVLKEVRPKGS